MGILRLIPDEMGGWDLEIDREAWRALLKDVDDLLLAEESDEQDDKYEDDHYPYRPETPEELAQWAAADRWVAAYPPAGPWLEWEGHYARVRPERIGAVHRLQQAAGDWDPLVQGAMTLCGMQVEDPHRFTTDKPTCGNCERRFTSMRAKKPDA